MERKSGFTKRSQYFANDASNSGIKSQSRSGSSMFFNSRSSRSFLGSKSNLFSNSKKSLGSDSIKFQHKAQIKDDEGIDVTPRSLLRPNDNATAQRKTQMKVFNKDNMTPTSSIFALYGQTQVATGAGQSIHQPFSQSIFGSSVSDMGISTSMSASMSEEFKLSIVKQATLDVQVTDYQELPPKELTEEDLDKKVEITLSETDTMWMLDIPGICVDLESEEAHVIQNNKKQDKHLTSQSGRHSDRYVQTINNANKFKQMQTDPILKKESGMTVSTWDMYDTFESAKRIVDKNEEETLEELNSRAISRIASGQSNTRSNQAMSVGVASSNADTTKIPGETSFMVSMIESRSDAGDNPNIVPKPKVKEEIDPTEPNNHPILKSEKLKDSFRIIERAITQNIYQSKQAQYRNMIPLEDPDSAPAHAESFNLNTPHLDKIWAYSCPLTKKRKVTCMAWNHSSKDIIAVGYGTFKAAEDSIGLICCWSIKNPEFPERIFHAPTGITSICFSKAHPNLLAAGLFNGNIVLYNVRNTSQESVLESRDALLKHSAPVWQVSWVTKEHSLGEKQSENLISISVDGHILQWSIHKGFESTQLMKLKRITVRPPTKKVKKSVGPSPKRGNKDTRGPISVKVEGGEAFISQHAPGLGFDFWPLDPNIYLACTEEGNIHKCSCSYNEQVLSTYTGHTGPVYRVSWCPFATDYFLSCSGDWTVKLWRQDKESPLQSFCASQKCINDICWSPFSSTLFGCVGEGRIEIWNIGSSCLDPMIIHRPISCASQTCITFAQNSKVVLVGDSAGEVTVYLLKNLPPLHSNQEEAFTEAIQSMTEKDISNTS